MSELHLAGRDRAARLQQHTPGPWHDHSHRQIGPDAGIVCEVWAAIGWGDGAIAEADANVRLIAAAPELYDAALHGAGPLAFQVYVLLRAWMDYGTGAIGFTRPISLHMLRAYCETHTTRGAGVQLEQPSEKAIRTALDRLQRSGLLRRAGGDRLAFVLPLALTAFTRPEQTRHGGGAEQSTEPGTGKTAPPAGSAAEPGAADTPAPMPNPAHIMNHVFLSSTCALADYLRGQDVQTAGKEDTIAGWRAAGVTLPQLGKAVATARTMRAKAGSRQPAAAERWLHRQHPERRTADACRGRAGPSGLAQDGCRVRPTPAPGGIVGGLQASFDGVR